ncbi:MAG: hypothetical protein MUC85_03345 [Anaerolineales bacterium]|jgi:hypothetical protein|nr:hypothetical protein [Anaerolineales bacterium]
MDESIAPELTEPSLPPVFLLPEAWEPHRGERCPACGEGALDYDGLLNLGCAVCGFSLSGCFT